MTVVTTASGDDGDIGERDGERRQADGTATSSSRFSFRGTGHER